MVALLCRLPAAGNGCWYCRQLADAPATRSAAVSSIEPVPAPAMECERSDMPQQSVTVLELVRVRMPVLVRGRALVDVHVHVRKRGRQQRGPHRQQGSSTRAGPWRASAVRRDDLMSREQAIWRGEGGAMRRIRWEYSVVRSDS